MKLIPALQMISFCSRGDNASYEQAEDIARILLEHSDLPLLYRARACSVLASACDEDSLAWAEETVRLTQLVVENSRMDMQKKEAMLESAIAVRDQARQTRGRLKGKAAATASEHQPTAPQGQKHEYEGEVRSVVGWCGQEGQLGSAKTEKDCYLAKSDVKKNEKPEETEEERLERMIAEIKLAEQEEEQREKAYLDKKRDQREANAAKEAEAAANANQELARREREAEEYDDKRQRVTKEGSLE